MKTRGAFDRGAYTVITPAIRSLTLTLTLTLTFDLIFIGGRGFVMDYTIPVPSLAILVSAVSVVSYGQTDRITDADDYRRRE